MGYHRFVADPERHHSGFPAVAGDNNALLFIGLALLLGVLPAWPFPGMANRSGTVWIMPPPKNPFEESLRKRKLSERKFRWPRPH